MDISSFVQFYESVKPVAPNELQVVVLRAEQLKAVDGTMFGGEGSSDPYVYLKIGVCDKQAPIASPNSAPWRVLALSACHGPRQGNGAHKDRL